jgi:hypothetical protein
MSNTPVPDDEYYNIIQCTGGNFQPPVVVEQVASEGEHAIRCKDEKWTRIVNMSYDSKETPIEKHVTFKFKWNLESWWGVGPPVGVFLL